MPNYGPGDKSSPTRFVSKILLEHADSFMYFVWLLSSYNGGIEYLRQNVYSVKPKILSDPLQ